MFVINLTGTFTGEDNKALQTFLSYFGKEMLDHIIIVFTCADVVEMQTSTSDKILKRAPEKFKELVSLCGGRYLAFNNHLKMEERRPQAKKLIEKIESLTSEEHGRKSQDQCKTM